MINSGESFGVRVYCLPRLHINSFSLPNCLDGLLIWKLYGSLFHTFNSLMESRYFLQMHFLKSEALFIENLRHAMLFFI